MQSTATSPNHVDCLDILPSFPRLRQQNLQTLYGTDLERIDKSRAGGVDARIQDLVDSINRHECYVTLSSCSGRIALFDPAATVTEVASNNINELPSTSSPSTTENIDNQQIGDGDSRVATLSGKGSTGAWLLVSHDEVDPAAILSFFENEGSSPSLLASAAACASCSFKFEPMLLHVAAANVKRGQQLLQIALQSGFRESGLVVTDERVTVAIRTQSLGLCIPLSRQLQSPLRPPNAYLVAIMAEANRRLVINLERMQKLHHAIQDSLLQLDGSNALHSKQSTVYNVQSVKHGIPDLYLYGHSMVSTSCGSQMDVDLLVFGGYGPGPFQKSPRRSSCVYVLSSVNSRWDAEWSNIELPGSDLNPTIEFGKAGRFKVEHLEWHACQSIAIASLSATVDDTHEKHVFVAFGGRKSPADPLGTLCLFTYNKTSTGSTNSRIGRFYKPLDVRGPSPTPRWGHTLTSLDDARILSSGIPVCHATPIAVLAGGRNEPTVNADGMYLLSIIPVDDKASDGRSVVCHFLWESINYDEVERNVGRFHHSAVALDPDHIFIFGGLLGTSAFAGLANSHADASPCVMVTLNRDDKGNRNTTSVSVDEVDVPSTVPHRFGHGACVLNNLSNGNPHVLLSGGICLHNDGVTCEGDTVLQSVQLVSNGKSWKLESDDIVWTSSEQDDMGSLTHHGCTVLLSLRFKSVVSFVGGGVAGFGFQDCYAASLCLSIERGAESRCADDGGSASFSSSRIGTSRTSNAVVLASSCPVAYVCAQNAKDLKTQLEAAGLIDKRYRLTKAVQSGITAFFGKNELSSHMAVPVCQSCIDIIAVKANKGDAIHDPEVPAWIPLVVGYGQQECPPCSGSFARCERSRAQTASLGIIRLSNVVHSLTVHYGAHGRSETS